jgi:hypothetical protein
VTHALLSYRPGCPANLAAVLNYERRRELKEGYFAAVLRSIAGSLIQGYELPPYHEFLQRLDGKADTRTGAEIMDDLKSKLLRRRKEREQ